LPVAIEAFQKTQTAILDSAARLLKPGGRLVYATCSLLGDENEAVADRFSEQHAQTFKLIPALQVLNDLKILDPDTLVEGPFLRLWPHRHQTDGFFAAVWERC
jgi:16S rRNA (cytosine967-C5)-methyltransferase